MRNGGYIGNYFCIGISRLNPEEQERLVNVLRSKLGLESHVTMGGKKLAIHNPVLVVQHIKPYFHASQLYRLVKQ